MERQPPEEMLIEATPAASATDAVFEMMLGKEAGGMLSNLVSRMSTGENDDFAASLEEAFGALLSDAVAAGTVAEAGDNAALALPLVEVSEAEAEAEADEAVDDGIAATSEEVESDESIGATEGAYEALLAEKQVALEALLAEKQVELERLSSRLSSLSAARDVKVDQLSSDADAAEPEAAEVTASGAEHSDPQLQAALPDISMLAALTAVSAVAFAGFFSRGRPGSQDAPELIWV